MEKEILERIEENKNIFSYEELLQIRKNYDLISKIYLLALIDMEILKID